MNAGLPCLPLHTSPWPSPPQDWALAADQLRPSLEAAIAAGDFVLAGESTGLIHGSRS